jgi:AcrR family transcriptional regulator
MSVLSLTERLAGETRRLILDAAVELLEAESVSELTIRAVAARSGMSERTVFRYFATRDDFLDAVASAVAARLHLPAEPRTIAELIAYPATLYRRFEASAALVKAALHSELFHRMRARSPRERWIAVGQLVDSMAPKRSERERHIAATNIRYFLSATTWHYYRFHFGFDLDDTIACAETAIRQALDGLSRRAAGARSARSQGRRSAPAIRSRTD